MNQQVKLSQFLPMEAQHQFGINEVEIALENLIVVSGLGLPRFKVDSFEQLLEKDY